MLCQENRLTWYTTWLSDLLQMWKEFFLNCHFLVTYVESFAAIRYMIIVNRCLRYIRCLIRKKSYSTVALLWSTLGHRCVYVVVLDLASKPGWKRDCFKAWRMKSTYSPDFDLQNAIGIAPLYGLSSLWRKSIQFGSPVVALYPSKLDHNSICEYSHSPSRVFVVADI